MHTTVITEGARRPDGNTGPGDIRVHHDSDWSGKADLQWTDEHGHVWNAALPGHVVRGLLAYLMPDPADKTPPTSPGPCPTCKGDGVVGFFVDGKLCEDVRCEACRGTGRIGAPTLAAELAEAVDLLRSVEHIRQPEAPFHRCPVCGSPLDLSEPHEMGCKLAAFLARHPPKET